MNAKLSIGADIGNTRDRFALVTLLSDGSGGHRLLDARARSNISADEQAAAVLETVTDMHKAAPGSVPIKIAQDRGGLGFGPAETVEKGIRARRRTGRLGMRSVEFRGVAIVAGDGTNRDDDNRWKWNVGRDLLVSNMLMALRTGGLDIRSATGEGADALRDELKHLQENTTRGGKVRVDHQPGKHDDLVMALALAYWVASTTGNGGYALIGRRSAGDPSESAQDAAAPKAQPGAPVASSGSSAIASVDVTTGLPSVRRTSLPWRMGQPKPDADPKPEPFKKPKADGTCKIVKPGREVCGRPAIGGGGDNDYRCAGHSGSVPRWKVKQIGRRSNLDALKRRIY